MSEHIIISACEAMAAAAAAVVAVVVEAVVVTVAAVIWHVTIKFHRLEPHAAKTCS